MPTTRPFEFARRVRLSVGLILVLVITVVAVVIFVNPHPQLRIKGDPVRAGNALRVEAVSLPSGQHVEWVVDQLSETIGSADADQRGRLATTIHVPLGTASGTHRLGCRWNGRVQVTQSFRVQN